MKDIESRAEQRTEPTPEETPIVIPNPELEQTENDIDLKKLGEEIRSLVEVKNFPIVGRYILAEASKVAGEETANILRNNQNILSTKRGCSIIHDVLYNADCIICATNNQNDPNFRNNPSVFSSFSEEHKDKAIKIEADVCSLLKKYGYDGWGVNENIDLAFGRFDEELKKTSIPAEASNEIADIIIRSTELSTTILSSDEIDILDKFLQKPMAETISRCLIRVADYNNEQKVA